jgi:membrane-associated phospholipid phosphatase
MMEQFKKYYASTVLLFLVLEISLIAFIDRPLSIALRQIDAASPTLIDFFRFCTNAGLGRWYLFPSGLGALVCLALFYCYKMPEKKRAIVRLTGQVLAYFFACVVASGILANIIKCILGRARPKLLQVANIYGFHPLSFQSDWHSMASGHSATGFAIAFAVSALYPRMRPLMLVFAIMISLSRVMVNAHYLSDVLAGAGIGWLTAYYVTHLFQKRGWLSL